MNWSAADSAEAERRYTVGLALTPRQAAHILGATFARGAHRGEPDRRRVLELVAAGDLRPVDPTQPTHRLTGVVGRGTPISGRRGQGRPGDRPRPTGMTAPAPDASDRYAIRCLRIDCQRSLFVGDDPAEVVAAYLAHPCAADTRKESSES